MQIHRPLRIHARLLLQGCIRDARRDARDLIFLAMIARMDVRRPVSRTSRPPSVRRGFRYRLRRFRPARIFTRGIALRTLADIRAVLDDFDGVVERALRRLPKTRIAGAVVIAWSAGDLAHLTPSIEDGRRSCSRRAARFGTVICTRLRGGRP
ncbi:MAG: hypothetical protein FD124_333 [Alphaproteobacteria bacterium]|nr:MAG: hypothetical protein FD124_333 [Alphaproteobacteria bacterium]